MSFWDIIWFIFISFAFFAYLMVLFSIIGDLFRDRETSGIAKALWMIALIFLPFLTALIYLVTRGADMADRSATAAAAMQKSQESYIKSVAASGTPADQIAQARTLLESGAISQAEYDQLKAKALA